MQKDRETMENETLESLRLQRDAVLEQLDSLLTQTDGDFWPSVCEVWPELRILYPMHWPED
jgi:hypothetical protein